MENSPAARMKKVLRLRSDGIVKQRLAGGHYRMICNDELYTLHLEKQLPSHISDIIIYKMKKCYHS
jgi:hypothetical protein